MEGLGETPVLSSESLKALLVVRQETFLGFMDREHNKGILFTPFDLRTPKGQDVARLFFWRCIEEYAEAISATALEHRLEELIDAFNYASAMLVGTSNIWLGDLMEMVPESWDSPIQREVPTRVRMGTIAYELANVTETFRNRSWMENSQSNYFDGMAQYRKTLFWAIRQIGKGFDSWEEFWRYFMAKDAVLKFRLRSNY